MTTMSEPTTLDRPLIERAADAAARMIPPVWPLASSVAVNPFLGQTEATLAEAGVRLARVAGTPVTMPRAWYRARIAAGVIAEADLAAAFADAARAGTPVDPALLGSTPDSETPAPEALPTVADLAADASGTDWPDLIAERFGAWAGGYLDQGQALWAAPRGKRAWTAWRAWATHDLTPEIQGLGGFAAFVADLPDDPIESILRATRGLGLAPAALDTYFHQLLLSLGGWSQYARYGLWRAELAKGGDTTIVDFLAIRLAWEEALYQQHRRDLEVPWARVRDDHARPLRPTSSQLLDAVLQDAADRAAQRRLAETLAEPRLHPAATRPALQAAFCIDVRSEVFRRALEAADPSIRTLGFAGFFGVFARHRRFASDVEELRLPVLLNPTVDSCAGGHTHAHAEGVASASSPDQAARYAARAKRAWGRFKLAAVSSFAFVEAMGPVYLWRLLRDALGVQQVPAPGDPAPQLVTALDLAARVDAAETVLRAMSLTGGFARVVLLAGHGASVVNNPHASALHCGACGGYSGEVNARLLAALLNDREVRRGLAERGIAVPDDTLFVAGLHDTTTDGMTLYDGDAPSPDHARDLMRIRAWLEAAGAAARRERSPRLPRSAGAGDVAARARNWAEVRPEWGLAGCAAFIAAPRSRTVGRDLDGRVFLHDYDWCQDAGRGFPVLELILTAPVVVASWISLQYYGSTVAPATFGAGNKLLHNVVGGMGVLEGNGGALKVGLPWQSVHDGEGYAHEPLRLAVCIEAPAEAIAGVLDRHPAVRMLFDKGWLHLFAMDAEGRLARRYAGGSAWTEVAAAVSRG